MQKKTVFVSIVGRPNVGKSSLLNKILGTKISIVSAKPQTTRTRITGVFTQKEVQLVFIDTPGIHKSKTELGRYMQKSVRESVKDTDVCLLVIAADSKISEFESGIIEKFKKLNTKSVLVINKVDIIKDKTVIANKIAEYASLFDFEAIVPLSARTGYGVEDLLDELKKLATVSEHFFDEAFLTDQPEKTIVSEIIREKMLRFLDKEIPHGVAVMVTKMRERGDESPIIDIDATIYCEKENHKGIIIGKNGSMLKKIGTCARLDVEKFFSSKVSLKLWVKVKDDWKNRESILKSLGYDKGNFS